MNKELIHDQIGSFLKEREEYLILRAQVKRDWSIRFNNGRIEAVSTNKESGVGVQAFTPEGISGFASTDILTPQALAEVVERAVTLAKRNNAQGVEPNREIMTMPTERADFRNGNIRNFEENSLTELQERVEKIHLRLRERDSDTAWQTSYRQIEDFWVIGRSDQTLVSYTIPRALLIHQGTVKKGKKAQSFLIHRNGTDVRLLDLEEEERLLEEKAVQRAIFTKRLLDAPVLQPGSYPLIIDYGLAKGLAHEAFGHAVESDHMKESVLGEAGKLKIGLQVARKGVHIIDGPLPGDWADQPYSANGIKRQTVDIVKDGILQAGLGDVFSAVQAGMPITGAGRAESYAHIPLPRMTNIRLLVDNVLPLKTSANILEEAAEIRQALQDAKLLNEKGKHLLLVGYRGGQVNPKTGDFVFQCSGIIDIAAPELTIYQPAIFSGKILEALKAIRGGIGETCFDAIGTCGKGGQAVPSSGGSHLYILMDQDDQVTLGGEVK